MGNCSSAVEARPRNIDRFRPCPPQALLDLLFSKVLLLGAGEAGKSTMFKQFLHVFGRGWPDSERRTYTHIVHHNTIVAIKTLCLESNAYGIVEPANKSAKGAIEELREEDEITIETGASIKALWTDPVIQTTYENGAKFQLLESAKYLFERIEETSKPDYLPTYQDLLRSHIRTTGIVEARLDIDGATLRVFDAGGQRCERKKWVHCFENSTAIIFVAAISEYDQVLFEDSTANRVEEALLLFEEISNSPWFENSAIILLLNKQDVFHEKLEKVPLQDHFPGYTGSTIQEAESFMLQLFLSKCSAHRHVETRFTCAVDEDSARLLFTELSNIIISKGVSRLVNRHR